MSVDTTHTIRLGTRGSALAHWQTKHVRALLAQAWPELETGITVFTTRGDKVLDSPLPLVGGKGLFTAELETALRNGAIDLAVHSLKDLPTDGPGGLIIGAVPERANPADVLVSREGYTLEALPQGASVGTSSRRRAAQLLAHRSDLKPIDIRGNVDTRINKALDPNGPYDAVVLAHAGLARLERLEVISEIIALDTMLPAPGQGALAVQCRNEPQSLELLAPINHAKTQMVVTAERAFLAALGGGCSVPIAAYGHIEDELLAFRGRVLALDGTEQIDVSGQLEADDLDSIQEFAAGLAQEALRQGAARLLEMVE